MTVPNQCGQDRNSSNPKLIQLFVQDNFTMVRPEASGAAAEPFILPLLPRTMTDFVASLCEHIWQTHARCAGVLLLFDIVERRWGFHVPNQRSGRKFASWTATADELAGMSESTRIAGSFQARILEAGETAQDAVPPFPGVHFVQQITDERRVIWSFLSVGDGCRRVPASNVILDELGLALDECDRRLTLV